MLTIKNLTKVYDKKTVVSGVSFTVGRGEAFALLGSNGAGKTTTIRMILGLAKKTAGEMGIGTDAIGYQPESPGFPPFLTGREVLEYYAKLQGMNKAAAKEEAKRLLMLTGLDDSKTKTGHYSKGMLQRLALAQALIGDPALLILDEPTAGLDAVGRVEMIRLLCRLKKEGKTIVINSHILSDIERICDKGLLLDKGRVYRYWDRYADEGKSLEQIFMETMEAVQ